VAKATGNLKLMERSRPLVTATGGARGAGYEGKASKLGSKVANDQGTCFAGH